jgi:hypothetical protein
MAETIKFKISPEVAVFLRPGISAGQKLSGLEAASSLLPVDQVTLVFGLMKDADASVREAAVSAFDELPENVILAYVDSVDAHPSVLDNLARVHYASPWVAQALMGCNLLPAAALEFLQEQALSAAEFYPSEDLASEDSDQSLAVTSDEESAEIDESDEEFQSKFKVAMVMGISEKIKMALSGDKEWRSILIRDSNKQVSSSVIKNPRITDAEIITILKVGVQNDEIIRLICANKEWVKNYTIRKALIDCPKTPLPNALRYLTTLHEKDIAGFAKSRNISSVISTQAKRLLLAKKR